MGHATQRRTVVGESKPIAPQLQRFQSSSMLRSSICCSRNKQRICRGVVVVCYQLLLTHEDLRALSGMLSGSYARGFERVDDDDFIFGGD
jgi:hypothetical protein